MVTDKIIKDKIKKRVEELKKMKASCDSGTSKKRYNFVITELRYLLE